MSHIRDAQPLKAARHLSRVPVPSRLDGLSRTPSNPIPLPLHLLLGRNTPNRGANYRSREQMAQGHEKVRVGCVGRKRGLQTDVGFLSCSSERVGPRFPGPTSTCKPFGLSCLWFTDSSELSQVARPFHQNGVCTDSLTSSFLRSLVWVHWVGCVLCLDGLAFSPKLWGQFSCLCTNCVQSVKKLFSRFSTPSFQYWHALAD